MKRRLALPLLFAAACSSESEPVPGERDVESGGELEFFDATAASGIDFVHDAGKTPDKHLPETMGAGVAWIRDGRVELYNLATDLGEHEDMAGAMPQRARDLHEKLEAWRRRVDAKMPPPAVRKQPTGTK